MNNAIRQKAVEDGGGGLNYEMIITAEPACSGLQGNKELMGTFGEVD